MFNVLDMTQGDLTRTRTYAKRRWLWIPAHAGQVYDGMLTLIVQKGSGYRGRKVEVEVDHYGVVEETASDLPPGIRAFLLENLERREQNADGPYRCVVGGMVEECSCDAGYFDRPRQVERQTSCKHRSALRQMCEEGVI